MHDAVAIAYNDVVGLHYHAADTDRHIDLAGTILVRPSMDGGAGVAGKVILGEGVRISNGTVNHQAGGATTLRDGLHDLAYQGAGHIAAAIDDDDIARPHQFQRLGDGEMSPDRTRTVSAVPVRAAPSR
jgi:hypothetical protein